MMSVKEAVSTASEVISSLIPTATNIRLEEAELSEEGPWWDITLSFPVEADSTFELLGGKYPRTYKVIRIDRETGEFRSIRIRKV